MILLEAWLCWVALLFLLQVCGGLLAPTASTNGIWISVPAHVRRQLTAEELAATIAHERGHMARGHPWKNLLHRALLLRATPRAARRQQELEADDWAAARGHGLALAAALRARSYGDFDMFRARRLERQLRVDP